MRRIQPLRRVLSLALVLVLLFSFVFAPVHASAATSTYKFKTGAVFNDPFVASRQNLVLHQILDAIDHAPKGANVYVASFTIDSPWAADTLISAKKRGVNVRVLVDEHNFIAPSSAMKKLKAALGTDRSKASYVYACSKGCMNSTASAMMHAKFYLISQVGRTKVLAKNVVMSGSTNLSTSGAKVTWNDVYTLQGNATIYNAFLKYFNDMKLDKDRADYNVSVASGAYRTYFYPQAYRSEMPDVTLQILKNIKCTGAAPGYGIGGHSVVRVAMQNWTAQRVELANQLWKLDDQGCDVQVMYGMRARTEPEVVNALLKKGGHHGGIKVYLSNSPNSKGERMFIHYKQILITGNYLGNSKSKLVFTGSGNFDWTSLRVANEQMLKIASAATFNQYYANFNHVRDTHSVAVTSAAQSTASVASTQSVESPAESDQSPDPTTPEDIEMPEDVTYVDYAEAE